MFKEFVVSDYDIFKSLIFSKVTLTDDEFILYRKFFYILYSQIIKPDLYVFLYQNTDRDLKNTGKGNLFVIFGEPDIEIIPAGSSPEIIRSAFPHLFSNWAMIMNVSRPSLETGTSAFVYDLADNLTRRTDARGQAVKVWL